MNDFCNNIYMDNSSDFHFYKKDGTREREKRREMLV